MLYSRLVGGTRDIQSLLNGLSELPGVTAVELGRFENGGSYHLPRFTFTGPNSSEPIRIGVFGGIHGDEPSGTLAAAALLRRLAADPSLAENYRVDIYPICNPTGFEDNSRCARGGPDLNRCFWSGINQPEVRMIEGELRENQFHGLIQLHADDTSDGLYGFVRGHTLSEHLLKPALEAAGTVLPRNVNALIDGFAAKDGIIYDAYQGILAAPAALDPAPFEIILETPQHAPLEKQVNALVIAMESVLQEYRRIVAFAANL